MSRAETPVVDEKKAAAQAQPTPGKYIVESTGAPAQVPLGADFDIEVGTEGALVSINGELKGPAFPLANGDFQVDYVSGAYALILQFRQTGAAAEYLFGVSMPAKSGQFKGMEDPPVTGVFGAESRPPNKKEPGGGA